MVSALTKVRIILGAENLVDDLIDGRNRRPVRLASEKYSNSQFSRYPPSLWAEYTANVCRTICYENLYCDR